MSRIESENVSQKMTLKSFEAAKKYKPKNVWILKSSWYPNIIGGLLDSSLKFFKEISVSDENIRIVEIPGACEFPVVARNILHQKSNQVDFIVTLGCVVKGETPHFEFVCNLAFEGLLNLQLQTGVPIGLGILTVDNLHQAENRMQKGAEASQAAFQVWALAQSNFEKGI